MRNGTTVLIFRLCGEWLVEVNGATSSVMLGVADIRAVAGVAVGSKGLTALVTRGALVQTVEDGLPLLAARLAGDFVCAPSYALLRIRLDRACFPAISILDVLLVRTSRHLVSCERSCALRLYDLQNEGL